MDISQQGIGLAIGDQEAVVAGLNRDGREWIVRMPSVVSAPSRAAGVELLLAGHEAAAAGMEPLLRAPRRWGYLPGEPEVARVLLAALLATMRQQGIPRETAGQPVVALPHTVGATAADILAGAALDAGWGEVCLVSELAALAAFGLREGETRVSAFGGRWVHQAHFRTTREGRATRLALQRLEAALAASPELPPPDAAALARGAAWISAAGPALHLGVAPEVPLMIGLIGSGDAFLPLLRVGETARVVRALAPPPADGVLLQVAAAAFVEGEARGYQVLAEGFLEPDVPGPWLLIFQGLDGLSGEVAVQSPSGATVLQKRFRIRLP